MIGGLQGEFGDSDIKYLKKNISKFRSHISGSFRRTSWHCAKWLRNFCSKRTTFSQPKADFAAVQHFAFSLEWSACNGCNSFVSTLNRVPFEALDCWLPDLWKWYIECRKWISGSAPKVAEMTVIKNASCQISLCFPSLHSGFAYGKGL